MNYFDDYYNDPQPRQEEPNYIPREPVNPQPPKPKKEEGGDLIAKKAEKENKNE